MKQVDGTFFVDDVPLTLTGKGIGTHAHGVVHDVPPLRPNWPTPDDPFARQQGLLCAESECVVGDGFVFVVGDNRDRSSRGGYKPHNPRRPTVTVARRRYALLVENDGT